MTTRDFVNAVQTYYGSQYPAGQQSVVYQYLNAKAEEYLDALYDAVIFGYSSKWGKLPDIAVFEEYKKQALDDYEMKKNRRTAEDLRGVRQISEDDIDIRAMAEDRGIDTNKDGWLARLLLAGLSKGVPANSRNYDDFT